MVRFNSDTRFLWSRSKVLKWQKHLIDLYPLIQDFLGPYDGVQSLGIGAKIENGLILDQICYRIYVDKKLSQNKLHPDQLIPSNIFGIPTDVLEATAYHNYLDTTQYRPIKGGILIKNKCHENTTLAGAASLGCIARTETDNKMVALTCLHVIADGISPVTNTGYDVGQPHRTTCCCCCHGDVIGEVSNMDQDTDSVIIELNTETANALNTSALENTIHQVGAITGAQEAVCFDEVEKYGAGSGHTFGVIVDVKFQGDKILISPGTEAFAAPGDSGSVIVHKDTKKVMGLLIGGLTDAESVGVAVHIGPVMTALNIKIGGQSAGALGIPAASCGVASAAALTNAQNWLDKYDNTSLPGLVLANTTDFANDAERFERRDAVENILGNILLPNWNDRRDKAINNLLPFNFSLPYHSTPLTPDEQDENRTFEDLEHLAKYQEDLYKDFFSDGSGGIDFVKLREAFELFANGNTRTFPVPAGASADQVARGSKPGGLREPDGAFILMFAEFAFLCLRNANNPNKPLNIINETVWLSCARIMVGMQELFLHIYRNGTQSDPPVVKPIYRGIHNTGPETRSYGDFGPPNFNLNNAALGQTVQLSATSSIGQSDNERKARIHHKYLGRSFDDLKVAIKENIQQMLRIT